MKKILADVLNEIKPSKEEEKEAKERALFLLGRINKGFKDAKAILGGSGIKGTWLRNANDTDIFVKFNYKKYKDKSSQISDILGKELKRKKLKAARLHGSRDYFQIKDGEITSEIIPILDIKRPEQAKNITDVSPLHANWVNRKGRRFRDDIRLLKQFCRSANAYGAESYIHGFSGYMCEILVIHHVGFMNLIRDAARWKGKVIIDTERHWKGKNILMELNRSKTYPPLVVIDPVHADRNAAAAVSEEKFELFKKKAREFLKNPSKGFFEIKGADEKTLRRKAKNNNLVLIDIKPKTGKEDVVGCKLVKSLEHINKRLEENDFKVLDYGWRWDKKALFYFIIRKEKLSDYLEAEGPPLKAKDHVKNFKKKHKKTFIRSGRIYAKVKRRFKSPEGLLKSLEKDPYLMERISGFRMVNHGR
ncbi:CCA tRNA nucleotidyltransferase [Candidatus Woesearchaeota archaeon]|nr:CCA tRNA nucleotidyltransferase [Candidatus Woesearchaeota archaeon]